MVDVVAVVTCYRQSAGRVVLSEVVRQKSILATQRERADVVFRQAHVRLAAEQRAALAQAAVSDAEAVFEHEDRLQAAAKIFGASQAPAIGLGDAVINLDELAAAAGSGLAVIHIGDTGVDEAVQRDAGLGLCSRSDRSEGRKQE